MNVSTGRKSTFFVFSARPKERGEEDGIVGGRTNSRRAGSVDVVMDEASNETKSLGDESNGKASSLSTRTSTSTNSDNSHGYI